MPSVNSRTGLYNDTLGQSCRLFSPRRTANFTFGDCPISYPLPSTKPRAFDSFAPIPDLPRPRSGTGRFDPRLREKVIVADH